MVLPKAVPAGWGFKWGFAGPKVSPRYSPGVMGGGGGVGGAWLQMTSAIAPALSWQVAILKVWLVKLFLYVPFNNVRRSQYKWMKT